MEAPQAHTALAAVTLDGEHWRCLSASALPVRLSYLTIPANVP